MCVQFAMTKNEENHINAKSKSDTQKCDPVLRYLGIKQHTN